MTPQLAVSFQAGSGPQSSGPISVFPGAPGRPFLDLQRSLSTPTRVDRGPTLSVPRTDVAGLEVDRSSPRHRLHTFIRALGGMLHFFVLRPSSSDPCYEALFHEDVLGVFQEFQGPLTRLFLTFASSTLNYTEEGSRAKQGGRGGIEEANG